MFLNKCLSHCLCSLAESVQAKDATLVRCRRLRVKHLTLISWPEIEIEQLLVVCNTKHLKLRFVFGTLGCNSKLTMCDIYSTRRALMLGVWFSFWAIHIVQTDAQQLRILPEVEKDEQVNEEGSTLTLTCINENYNTFSSNLAEKIKWNLPLSEVI